MGPTTPVGAWSTTSPYGNCEYPFNLPHLVSASGATYVARWTILHLRELERSIAEALVKPGFSFIEVLSPCPAVYGRHNKLPRGLDEMKGYRERSVIRDGADTKDVDISLDGPIVVGKFVDTDRPTLQDCYRQMLERARKQRKQ